MCFDTKALGFYRVLLSVMHACEGLSKKCLSTMQPRYLSAAAAAEANIHENM